MDLILTWTNIIQKNGKRVFAWAFEGEWEYERIRKCNEITLEYPKGSGKLWTFPEIDQAIMMNAKEAEQKPLIDRLLTYLTEQDIKTNH